MTRNEFETMAVKSNDQVSPAIYDAIEYFYMADNDYHAHNGGVDETKHAFVSRVFGGKVNTPKSIVRKVAARLIEMDSAILAHYLCVE